MAEEAYAQWLKETYPAGAPTSVMPAAGPPGTSALLQAPPPAYLGSVAVVPVVVPAGGPVGRAADPSYRTKLCSNWQTTGKCRYGDRCLFAHGMGQLREFGDPSAVPAQLQAPPPAHLQGPPPAHLQGPPPAHLQGPPPAHLQGPPPANLQGPPPAQLQGPPPAHLQALQGPPPATLQGPPPANLQGPPPAASQAAPPAHVQGPPPGVSQASSAGGSPDAEESAEDTTMWKYLDDEGESQGPYTTMQLNIWYLQGYMPPDREVWKDTGEVGEMPDFLKVRDVPELCAAAQGKVAEAMRQQQLYAVQQQLALVEQQEMAAKLAAAAELKREVAELPCKFFLQGRCRNGDNCKFAHVHGVAPPVDSKVAAELRAKLLRDSMEGADIPEGFSVGFVKTWNDVKGFGFISPAMTAEGLVPPDLYVPLLQFSFFRPPTSETVCTVRGHRFDSCVSEIEHLHVVLLLSTMQVYPPPGHQLDCAGQRQPFTWDGCDVTALSQANKAS